MSARQLAKGAAFALVVAIILTVTDHGMRKTWMAECMRGDTVTCPDKMWWFERGADSDGELMELSGGVHPLEM